MARYIGAEMFIEHFIAAIACKQRHAVRMNDIVALWIGDVVNKDFSSDMAFDNRAGKQVIDSDLFYFFLQKEISSGG